MRSVYHAAILIWICHESGASTSKRRIDPSEQLFFYPSLDTQIICSTDNLFMKDGTKGYHSNQS